MTDILIKNMEMPKSCYTCQFCDNYEGSFCLATNNEHQIDHMTAIRRRPKWCPLVEVKPHGDLKDANIIMQWLNLKADNRVPVTVGEIIDFIEKQSIIVEATE